MLLPTKHENLDKNVLVLGADIVQFLKRNGTSSLDEVYEFLKTTKNISMDKYNDTVLFLWLIDFVDCEDSKLSLVNS